MSKFDKIIEKISEFEEIAIEPMPVEVVKEQTKMSKFDRLIKKIEVFERLSLYGDRATFLESLSQSSDEWTPEELDQANQPVQTNNIPAMPPASITPPPVMNAPAVPEQAKPAPKAPTPQQLSQQALQTKQQMQATFNAPSPFQKKPQAPMTPAQQKALQQAQQMGQGIGNALHSKSPVQDALNRSNQEIPPPDLSQTTAQNWLNKRK